MKQIFLFFLLIIHNSSYALPSDSLLNKLNYEIKQAGLYDNNKLQNIARLKKILNGLSKNDNKGLYDISLELYDEYKYYNYDEALYYAKKLKILANAKKDASLIIDSKIKAAFIMLSGGMFKETFDSLSVIAVKDATDPVKAEYYSLMGRSYYNLADFNNDIINSPFYTVKANLYLDSALTLYPVKSFEYVYYSALKFLKTGYPDSALSYLNKILERADLTHHQVALTTSTIGGILLSQEHDNKAIPYLVQASIADIQSSTKETLALLTLAGIIYKIGKVENAAAYIEKANADALFYNARLRKVQVGAILPLIEGEMINTIKSQKQKLLTSIILLAFLVLLLAGFAIIIRNQVKKLKLTRGKLLEANLKQQQANQQLTEANELKERYNDQLKEINKQLVEANEIKGKYNNQLQLINQQLSEANKIKEEYIGYYFSMDTEFLARIEKLIHSIDKKILERKWDEGKVYFKKP